MKIVNIDSNVHEYIKLLKDLRQIRTIKGYITTLILRDIIRRADKFLDNVPRRRNRAEALQYVDRYFDTLMDLQEGDDIE